jgi:RNA polymerase sigma-70 factor (sigma-E family)
VDDLGVEFDSFVRARTPALLRSAYLLTGDRHLAEDLVQSALARTHRAWRRLYDSGNAEAYTRKIMYNLQVSWWRRRRVAESLQDTVPEPRPQAGFVDDAQQTAVRLTLREALLRLTSRQRAFLVLRYFEDLTEVETAEILGVAVGTVKSQTARALTRLRAAAPELADLHATNGATR